MRKKLGVMETKWIRVSRDSHNVYINIQMSWIDFFIRVISPYYDVELSQAPEKLSWKIYTEEPQECYNNQWDIIIPSIPGENFLKRKYKFAHESKSIYIMEPVDAIVRLQIATRLCRDILRHLFMQELVYFHAGMVVYRSIGIAIMGDKKSGKTSSILTFLSTKNANYVTNDDLAISIAHKSSDPCIGYGWPRAVSIRRDSLEFMRSVIGYNNPIYNGFLGRQIHPNNHVPELMSYLYLYPNDLVELFKCKVIPNHRIDVILVTKFGMDGCFSARQVFSNEKHLLISSNYDNNLGKYFADFEHTFTSNVMQPNRAWFDSVPCYIVSQNIRNMNNLIDWIDSEYV